jgi:hypothetical protein
MVAASASLPTAEIVRRLNALSPPVEQGLRRAGVACPQVGIRRVGALDRDPMTSKVRRFVPLPARIG